MAKESNYLKESYRELKNVSFPKKNELIHSSLLVLGITLLIALGFALMDVVFGGAYDMYIDATAPYRASSASEASVNAQPIEVAPSTVTATDGEGNPVEINVEPVTE